MAARLTRAKKKIAIAGIPFRIPERADLRARINAVLLVIHLLFTTGHTSPVGEELSQVDLVERSLDLARMLHALIPDDGEVTGLLALILLTDSRRQARTGADGSFLTLADQDRDRWHRASIDEGLALVGEALRGGRPGPFTLMASIAAVHSSAPHWDETDWKEIVGLYDLLIERVALARRSTEPSGRGQLRAGARGRTSRAGGSEHRASVERLSLPRGRSRQLSRSSRTPRRSSRRLRRSGIAHRERSGTGLYAVTDRGAEQHPCARRPRSTFDDTTQLRCVVAYRRDVPWGFLPRTRCVKKSRTFSGDR